MAAIITYLLNSAANEFFLLAFVDPEALAIVPFHAKLTALSLTHAADVTDQAVVADKIVFVTAYSVRVLAISRTDGLPASTSEAAVSS